MKNLESLASGDKVNAGKFSEKLSLVQKQKAIGYPNVAIQKPDQSLPWEIVNLSNYVNSILLNVTEEERNIKWFPRMERVYTLLSRELNDDFYAKSCLPIFLTCKFLNGDFEFHQEQSMLLILNTEMLHQILSSVCNNAIWSDVLEYKKAQIAGASIAKQ